MPDGSESGSSSVDVGYFALHGITSGPNDDFNFMFNRLAIKEGWSKTQRKKRRHEAIAGEIEAIYGADTTKLEKWQELCRDVRIEPVPQSITKCKKALGSVYVNLVNLINHRRNRSVPVILFPNYQAFRTWTLGGKKFGDRIFPKKLAKEEGFVKALLKDLHFPF
ncbi:hypothetical protein BU25DRAFT_416862 [Macroventuria anomochaeta]|uniref:Uncharacterized protein n=1 Tax=Macroventuria anomochaeta TaxID=301207 RepID=A0ACB6SI81_9PLEO|nr:uncharacterized protein BU25DRAFT_416862 [Macroventuria anomochaeta]KAF2633688.1 hypothetical protein BU25DRAFT_416862 [Macroventuria anomochaeta]